MPHPFRACAACHMTSCGWCVLMPQNIPSWTRRATESSGTEHPDSDLALTPANTVAGSPITVCRSSSSWDAHPDHALGPSSLLKEQHPSTLACIMTATQTRPYRRILTSALHRRFVHASALALLVCYTVAIAIGDKSSCEYCRVSAGARALVTDLCYFRSFLVMVPYWRMRSPRGSALRLIPRHLRLARGAITPWLENDTILSRHV